MYSVRQHPSVIDCCAARTVSANEYMYALPLGSSRSYVYTVCTYSTAGGEYQYAMLAILCSRLAWGDHGHPAVANHALYSRTQPHVTLARSPITSSRRGPPCLKEHPVVSSACQSRAVRPQPAAAAATAGITVTAPAVFRRPPATGT